jgi:hypothetical protein
VPHKTTAKQTPTFCQDPIECGRIQLNHIGSLVDHIFKDSGSAHDGANFGNSRLSAGFPREKRNYFYKFLKKSLFLKTEGTCVCPELKRQKFLGVLNWATNVG